MKKKLFLLKNFEPPPITPSILRSRIKIDAQGTLKKILKRLCKDGAEKEYYFSININIYVKYKNLRSAITSTTNTLPNDLDY